ncbi:RagB/SusD family nutrient uptake outer membrane protein [Pedobacter hiemivivus]|uniref:RagB/SusD family nutrient uptake outer membrane protein n=1 Tax=Pedobacter hiemivivus TaxID=2530454 RepID=A0A4R0N500_9SPHI|nr:RagB/SusD family nutrient uptake outer membrane protein [Pedobacter hiemivivus]TCC95029.1 RagB/SusD family nutrient uptake outer membrane protein [Pedobacter hiemivivus]
MKTTYLKIIIASLFLLGIGTNYSCKKFLEAKSDQKLAVPTSLEELQGLLDNFSVMNQTIAGTGEASSDNYYLTKEDWESLSYENEKRIYTWEKDFLFPQDGRQNEWQCNYTAIYYSNTVLGALEKINRNQGNASKWDNIKGQALFFRAQYLLRTVLLWAVAFDETTASSDLGIPLRYTEDFNIPSVRSSVSESYRRILDDLEESANLLPIKSNHPAHPSKLASYGLLARTNLAMRRYSSASKFADSCLNLYSRLMDFNSLNQDANFPIQQFNEEVILWNRILAPGTISNSVAKIDQELYDSYEDNDLRKTIYFFKNADGSKAFKGYYEQLASPFGGIATDEIYLIKAECDARLKIGDFGMQSLNTLLKTRFKEGKFIPKTAISSDVALSIILAERRKELLMRDLRWMDIKRLNKEGANIKLTRILGDQTYVLQPNDPRYALPIPEDVIRLSGMPQNKR